MSRARIIVLAILAVGALFLLWRGVLNLYLTPRHELFVRIGRVKKEMAQREQALNDEVAQRLQLRDAAQRTLGGSAEEAVSTMRARLNTIGHGVGLNDLRVSTAPVRAVGSPASSAYSRESAWKSMARQPDFLSVSADFSGQGSLDQVVRALEIIAAEPYIKRIERVALRPRRAGEVVDLSVSLTTVILPETEAQSLPEPEVAQATLFAALTDKNMFRAPPPRAPDPPPVKAEVKPEVIVQRAPLVPWSDWVVTGIAWIDGRPELWVRNTKTSESRQLRSGDRLLEAQVEEINRTEAIVAIDGLKFSVEIGQTLGDRRPVNQ